MAWATVLAALCGGRVAAQEGGPHRDSARLAACDSGTFTVTAGGREVGREAFVVRCRGSAGITVSAAASLALPSGSVNVHIALELDTLLHPERVRVTGQTGATPIADTIEWRGDSAFVVRRGARRVLAVTPGGAFVGANFHTGLWLALARYDLARGGRQTIPVFPQHALVAEALPVERLPRPPVSVRPFHVDLGPQRSVVWADQDGRVVALMYPRRHIAAVRAGAEFAAAASAVRALAARQAPAAPGPAAGPRTTRGDRTEDVRVAVGGRVVSGTLSLPRGSFPVPAVVLVPGSGALDRDGRIPVPGLAAYRPMRDLAHALVQNGVAALQLEPRGPVPLAATAREVHAAVTVLRARPDIAGDRVGLLGHSAGALVVLMVASADSALGAAALLAAPAAPGDAVFRAQLEEHLREESRPASAGDSARRALASRLDSLRRGEHAGDPAAVWAQSFIALEPTALAARVRAPVILLHGALDRQVPPDHADMLATALERAGPRPDVTVSVLDGLNHLLLPAITGAVAEYSQLRVHTLPPVVLSRIGDWFRRHLAERGAATADR